MYIRTADAQSFLTQKDLNPDSLESANEDGGLDAESFEIALSSVTMPNAEVLSEERGWIHDYALVDENIMREAATRIAKYLDSGRTAADLYRDWILKVCDPFLPTSMNTRAFRSMNCSRVSKRFRIDTESLVKVLRVSG
jgi:hypothetical protein